MNLPEAIQIDQEENHAVDHHGVQDASPVHPQHMVQILHPDDAAQAQFKQLAQCNAQTKPGSQRYCQQNDRLPEQDTGNVSLAHAQDIIQAEFFLPATNQERIGIKQEDKGKESHDPGAQFQQ